MMSKLGLALPGFKLVGKSVCKYPFENVGELSVLKS